MARKRTSLPRAQKSAPKKTNKGTAAKYETVWKGPQVHGLTHSQINAYKESPELCAVAYLDGLRPKAVDIKMEYGTLHHLFDESYANARAGLAGFSKSSPKTALKLAADAVRRYLGLRITGLAAQAKHDLVLAGEQVIQLYPLYLDHYKHQEIEWVARESVFRVRHDVPAVPSSRYLQAGTHVLLTGKRDGLYKAREKGVIGLGLWEIKTKTKIDRTALREQLRCDSQSLFYLWATLLECREKKSKLRPIQETYDVLKRPALKRHQNESINAYINRCKKAVEAKRNEFFARETIPVLEAELEEYSARFLTPEIKCFLEWWGSIENDPSPEGRTQSSLHYLGLGALINAWGKSRYYDHLVGNQSSHTVRSIAVPFPELLDDFDRAATESEGDATPLRSLSQRSAGDLQKALKTQVDNAFEKIIKKKSCRLKTNPLR